MIKLYYFSTLWYIHQGIQAKQMSLNFIFYFLKKILMLSLYSWYCLWINYVRILKIIKPISDNFSGRKSESITMCCITIHLAINLYTVLTNYCTYLLHTINHLFFGTNFTQLLNILHIHRTHIKFNSTRCVPKVRVKQRSHF